MFICLKKLCNAVQKYNFNHNQKYVSGCVLLLEILYLHKLKCHGIAEPCTLPLIQNWNNDKIRTRIKEESAAGSYGHGELVVGVYPVSSTGEATMEEQSKRNEYQSKTGKNRFESTSAGDQVSGKFIKYELPVGELDNTEIHKIAVDNLEETLLMFKRDIYVVSNYHMTVCWRSRKEWKRKKLSLLLKSMLYRRVRSSFLIRKCTNI